MPRNGSGTFSPPGGTSAVGGATISSSSYNTLVDDIGDEITASLPRNGAAGMTAALPLADGTVGAPAVGFTSAANRGLYKTTNGVGMSIGGTLVAEFTSAGVLNGSGTAYATAPTIAWADVASATTTDIGAQASENLRITGTTTITGLGTVASGTTRNLRFAGILTFTHNATSLILPGGANITTAADDRCTAKSLGSGNWIITSYTKASGLTLVSEIPSQTSNSGKFLTTNGTSTSWAATGYTLGTAVASTSGTSIDFTGLPSTATRVTVMLSDVSTNGSSQVQIQIGDSGGIETTGYVSAVGAVAGASAAGGSATSGFILVHSAGGGAANVYTGITTLVRINSTTWVQSGTNTYSSGSMVMSAGNKTLSPGPLDRVRITTVNGTDTFDAGSINILYE